MSRQKHPGLHPVGRLRAERWHMDANLAICETSKRGLK